MTTDVDVKGPGQMAEGQPDMEPAATSPAATVPAPKPEGGQSGDQDVSSSGPAAGPAGEPAATEYFFDPKTFEEQIAELPPELQANVKGLHKQFQSAFTKKTQAIRDQRQKIEAYDAFYQDPLTNLQRMASQAGYRLTRAEAAEMAANAQNQTQPQQWEPQTWDEVIARSKDEAKRELLQELQPILGQVQEMRRTNVEQMLDTNFPDWRQYEDDMVGLLQKHPSLSSDPATLYRLAVPHETQEAQIYQRLLTKQQEKVKSSKIGGGSSTTKQPTDNVEVKTFDDAVRVAKARVAAMGLKPPS